MAGPEYLSEEDAQRLLARAVELDARAQPLTVDQLRAVAIEAGIAPEAFDRAVAETTGPLTPGPAPATLWASVKGTLKAGFITWVSLVAVVRVCSLVGAGWELRDLADVVALTIGAVAAHRFRARLARVGLIGMASAEFAEWVIHSVYGIGVVQGSAAHITVLAAGLLGALGVAAASATSGSKLSRAPELQSLAASDPHSADAPRALELRAV